MGSNHGPYPAAPFSMHHASPEPAARPSRPAGAPLARRAIVAALAALLLGSLFAVVEPRPATASAAVNMTLTRLEQTHLQRLNDWRAGRGLSRLSVDAVTQLDARDWTLSMAKSNNLAHDPHAGAACDAASPNCSRWAENVGYSTSGESSVFTAFVNSSGHRSNMASPHVDRVGIGVYVDGAGRTWITQRFIKCGCTNDTAARNANTERAHFEDFVRALYVDFLSRNGTSAEVRGHVDLLVYRASLPGVISSFSTSNEWLGALIDSYYQSTLGRNADAEGKQNWMNTYRSGWTPARIASAFYASTEFYQRSGNTNRAWITELYRQILGRNPDQQGLEDWKRKADRGVPRRDIAYSFFQSYESRRFRVIGLYDHLLGRFPDSSGMATWTERLENGRDVQLATTLASSAEYRQRATARF